MIIWLMSEQNFKSQRIGKCTQNWERNENMGIRFQGFQCWSNYQKLHAWIMGLVGLFLFLRSSMDHFWSIWFGLNFKKVMPDTIVCVYIYIYIDIDIYIKIWGGLCAVLLETWGFWEDTSRPGHWHTRVW